MSGVRSIRRYLRSADSLYSGLAAWLAMGVCLFVVILSWYGYRAILEWQRSYELLAERRSREGANLLLEALTRDMRGVQAAVLTSPDWGRFAGERPYEMSNLVASAFARYPYPESFFVWGANGNFEQLIFFNRSDRRPPWMAFTTVRTRFPVVTEQHLVIGGKILGRIQQDAARSHRLSAFEITLEGIQYQVVAQLNYRDVYREQLSQVIGFTINLPWIRQHYFRNLTQQVWNVGGGAEGGLALSVTDAAGALVAGSPIREHDPLTSTRHLELLFFNPDLLLDPPSDLPSHPWAVRVSAAGDAALSQAISGANRTLLIGATSALALAIGLVLTARAARANVKLAEMRSDFVSTVTHELKTPIATIRAAAETWSQSRLSGIDTFQSYGRLVVDEAKRLERLVQNLLTYARINDVAEAYTFERLPVGMLFNDLQQEFEAQLDEAGFDLQINIAQGVNPLRGDRLALRLLFDNLIDNAIRYSQTERRVHLSAEPDGRAVIIRVSDSGIGIAPEEVPLVTRKFVRGRGAPSGGSGLGLAIASRIAGDHGGSLSIRSTYGEGTTVSVRLPAA
jgi:signal transduction histidine kinase